MTINHESDVTEVDYPESDELPDGAPRDAGEVFDIVVRNGPISHDAMMRDQIHTMSSDRVFRSLQALKEIDLVDCEHGSLEEHGTTRRVWYVPTGDDDE